MFRLRHAALLVATLAACPLARAADDTPPDKVCLYDGKAFSEGALLRVEGILLRCTIADSRLLWQRDGGRVHRAALHRPMAHRHIGTIRPRPAASAKCFAFNGKEYCE